MKKITTLLLAILMVLPALAAHITGGTKLYFEVGNINQGNERYAAYFFNNSGNTWVSFTQCAKDVTLYEVTAPSGTWANVIFCRMNGSNATNNWDTKWDQSEDLVYTTGKDLFTASNSKTNQGKIAGLWGNVTVTLAGALNGWNTSSEVLEQESAKVFSAIVDDFEGEFKILINGRWYGGNNFQHDATITGNGNMTWNGAKGTVKIVVDMTDNTKKPVLTIEEIALPTGEFEANIRYGMYYLKPGAWDKNDTWYAAQFVNAKTGAIKWVYGLRKEKEEGGKTYVGVHYGLEDTVNAYTHIMFCAMKGDAPVFNEEKGKLEDEGSAAKLMTWNNVVACSKYLTYTPATDPAHYRIYFADDKEWQDVDPNDSEIATSLDRVEAANGIGYAYGVVSAEGAIEVYNVNGAVVARGNNNVDLRGLGRGVYIIRTGNQVRKVVR